ncbi:hypothetical protein [Tahibacter soli]|jgi:hypothetical protein|uniref:Uncharacterized protein n=1 Tax=Tahibacter soli TaxID=2983605 RepID=A0A9X3YKA5_9GAMM|nr:hypothetical protein [Tahibacter soli]MDC8012243.1 hypothetical protein [Tahibacter soli]
MKHCYADDMLWVRSPAGDLRQLFVYQQPRPSLPARDEARIRWARDDEGHWYSFSRFDEALIESVSGDWFAVVGRQAPTA